METPTAKVQRLFERLVILHSRLVTMHDTDSQIPYIMVKSAYQREFRKLHGTTPKVYEI
jgi:hypothetical protein